MCMFFKLALMRMSALETHSTHLDVVFEPMADVQMSLHWKVTLFIYLLERLVRISTAGSADESEVIPGATYLNFALALRWRCTIRFENCRSRSQTGLDADFFFLIRHEGSWLSALTVHLSSLCLSLHFIYPLWCQHLTQTHPYRMLQHNCCSDVRKIWYFQTQHHTRCTWRCQKDSGSCVVAWQLWCIDI